MSTESGSPLDLALDVLVYLPLGVAITVAEEIPKLTDKGRQRVTGRLRAAHLVGQFAVGQGRRMWAQRTSPPPGGSAASSPAMPAERPAAPSTVAPPAAGPAGPAGDVPAGPTAATDAPPATGAQRAAGAPTAATTPPKPAAATTPAATTAPRRPAPATPPAPAAPAPSADGPVPDVSSLAIPGYDSLSASQVVQRLAGLSADELEQVRRYEAAGRGRRTILARVSQLEHR